MFGRCSDTISIIVRQGTSDLMMLVLVMTLCCMLPSMFRPQTQVAGTSESDSWYTTFEVQEAYNTVVSEVDEWRKRAESKRSKGVAAISSFISRKKPVVFAVTNEVPLRLFRVRDEELGEISFEYTATFDGATLVRSTYNYKARALVQDLKVKMPVKVPGSAPKVCPSCGKDMMPDYKTCPYCGAPLV